MKKKKLVQNKAIIYLNYFISFNNLHGILRHAQENNIMIERKQAPNYFR